MKMIKRIFAMVMAVMLIVALVPFTVSAATPTTSFTVKCDKADFEFDVYQVATVDTETGLYTAVATDEGIIAAVNDGSAAQGVFAACEAAKSDWGTKLTTYTSGKEAKIDGNAGIFYIKNTEKPSTVKSVSNSLVVAPEYKDGAWVDLTEAVDLSSKVELGNVSVSKEIVGTGKYTTSTHTTAAVGDTITFKLTASIVGSKAEMLKGYTIHDTHDKGLKLDKIKSVVVTGGEGEDITLTADDYEVINETETGFDVNLKVSDKVLGNAAFYGKANVVVTYDAVLTSDAKIGGQGTKNSDSLGWVNSGNKADAAIGNNVFVYTFKIVINKKEKGTDKALDGVKFAVYGTKADAEAGTNAIADLTTKDGVAELSGVNAGTYYVKETGTIEGYNLNTAIHEVKIEPTFSNDALASVTDGTVSVTVYNTKTKLPQTGVEGTMAFTFVGAGLILLAGALFVVAMKKKSAK